MTTTRKVAAAVSGEANAAVIAERLRVAAIIESPEGKRNPALAAQLALRTVLDAESAKGILSQAPAANPYLQAMNKEGPIGLDAATADFAPVDPKAARLAEIKEGVKAFNKANNPGRRTAE